MKSLLKYVSMACVALAFASCVQDLDVQPIDQNTDTRPNLDALYTKCYAVLGLTGPDGAASSDVDKEGIDPGTSGFYRMIWFCNELTTDEVWWTYNDEETKQLTTTCWTGSNFGIWAIYIRLMLDIKYCNHYLALAKPTTDEEKYRYAEVRFIRALHYYYLMDMYLYVPFILDDTNEDPHLVPRYRVYAWLVGELETLEGLLPPVRKEKYRVGKAAAQLLLARTYLNADVYNKYNPEWTPDQTWQKAYDAADATINDNKGFHDLVSKDQVVDYSSEGGYVYSAYQQLFMGDNHRPEIIKESVLQIYQDGIYGRSYAGASLLVKGPRDDGMIPCGADDGPWHSMRTSPTMVDKFIKLVGIGRSQAANMVFDEYNMPAQLKDDRAILCSKVQSTKYSFKLTGNQGSGDQINMYECWAPLKFTGMYTTAKDPKEFVPQDKGWPDTDIPFMRIAEAYLIRGEANARKNGNDWSQALADVNVLRDRANAKLLTAADMNEETMLDEWSREFWFEGRRRIDLIRFGRFFGPEADEHQFHWEGRMAANDGDKNFVSGTPEYMNWFPIPSSDKSNNPNFATDVLGDPNNKFASRGGDGYPY